MMITPAWSPRIGEPVTAGTPEPRSWLEPGSDGSKGDGTSAGREGTGPDVGWRPFREGNLPVSDTRYQPVAVSRRICAPAHDIFQILANPVRHPELDGSGMLRGAVSATMISGVGDVFVMKMYYSELGDYEMNNHVVDYEADRRIGWEPEAGRGHRDADRMNVRQERVSAIERAEPGATEVRTLAAYVQALGGRLEIIADVGGERIMLR
jgi:hypothetical protein